MKTDHAGSTCVGPDWFAAARLALAVAVNLLAGCGEHPAGPPPSVSNQHEHQPPHGGTPVELGEEEFHLELVVDATTGKLTAYVMDGELENFIRIPAASFEIVAKVGDKEETLTFKPVANPATGETAGNTSQFETQADWVKTTRVFDALLKELAVSGRKFTAVRFNFPNGNEKSTALRK